MNHAPVGLLAAFVILTGCSSTPPPPPDTRAADEQAIRALEAQYNTYFNAKDVDKVIAIYAEDASALMPNEPVVNGKGAIRSSMQKDLADPAIALESTVTRVEVARSGDLAYSQGAYTYNFTDPKTKRVMTQAGKYVEVYKKQTDGSWKILEDTAIPDGPATALKGSVPGRGKGKNRSKKAK